MSAQPSEGYAVVDVETTGLRPSWHDRIAEVGVVLLSREGEITGEWSTLVNPRRDLGPQAIHAIRAADVRHAPTFGQVAGWLAGLLANRVIVAHNLRFDLGFLRAEFAAHGLVLPLELGSGLCTMELAATYLPGAPRSLVGCCETAGVAMDGHHDALSDARSAAKLLSQFVRKAGRPEPWVRLLHAAANSVWPPQASSPVECVRRGVSAIRDRHFLARIVDRLPRVPQPPQADTYLALLDRALLDRHISATEADTLVEVATTVGLDRTILDGLHRNYIAELATAAWMDGVVTAEEERDLTLVSELLGLSRDDSEAALNAAEAAQARSVSREDPSWGRFALRRNDLVVFTGQMDVPRDIWEQRAYDAGLRTHRSVTRQVRLVVSADPDSLSGKARQARGYGIPIVSCEAFERMLDEIE
ncbi:exonuclease domain-containing protein [Flindersiella endophytica]